MCSLVPLVKHYFVTMEKDDNLLKNTCQPFKGFLTCKGRSGELPYINFLHTGLSTLGLYPEELNPENFYLKCPDITKMDHTHKNGLK